MTASGWGLRFATAATMMTIAACHAATPPELAIPSADATPTSVVAETRRVTFAVPAGFRLQQVDFADGDAGYASLWSSDPVNLATTKNPAEFRYASAVFATTDGGRTWRALEDPRAPSAIPQTFTVDARTIVLQSSPEGWYVSKDGGSTFRFDAGMADPPELAHYLTAGSYRLDCETSCRIVGPQVLSQPGLPGVIGAVIEVGGAVWAGSLDGAAAYTASSGDQGRTWRRLDVPAHPRGPATRLTMVASPDGQDLWLVGSRDGGVGGRGSVVPTGRTDVGVPLLWLQERDRWVAKGTVGSPEPSTNPYSVAAIGGGFMAVAGPHMGLSLVDDAWHTVALSPRAEYVTTLRDGTVFAANNAWTTFYLGTRDGALVRWAQLVIDITT